MDNFVRSSRKKRRVLMVDDEQINRELLEAILSFNYDVDSAVNGKEAMDMLRAAEEPYSLLLLDLLMPVMSGFQVLEACKEDEELAKIPIIVMTSEKSAEVRSIKLGADDFITKPYRKPEVILARCERIIELSEERALIRDLEKDKLTGLYKEDFFFAYIRRMETNSRRRRDAVVLRVEGFKDIEKTIGTEKTNLMLRKIADSIKAEVSVSKWMGCYSGSGVFYAYCNHRDDYEDLIGNTRRAVSEQFGDFALKAGVYEKVDKTIDPEVWFERAGSVIADIAEGSCTAKYQ